jgi:hypothetical protein
MQRPIVEEVNPRFPRREPLRLHHLQDSGSQERLQE